MTEATTNYGENVLGEPLQMAGTDPITGFYRNGYCATGPADRGRHVVAAVMTDAFLQFSKSMGNDLISPNPMYGFPGLKAGDTWCLCALRWKEAFDAGVAPPVVLAATHKSALAYTSLASLQARQASF